MEIKSSYAEIIEKYDIGSLLSENTLPPFTLFDEIVLTLITDRQIVINVVALRKLHTEDQLTRKIHRIIGDWVDLTTNIDFSFDIKELEKLRDNNKEGNK